MKNSTRMLMMNAGRESQKDREKRDYYKDSYSMPEDKFSDRRGREHYDNGRYAPMRNEYNAVDREYVPVMMGYSPYMPPYYDQYMQPSNKIGFSLEGEMEKMPHWEESQKYKSDNRENYHQDKNKVLGFYPHKKNRSSMKMDKDMAERWVSNMENEDGTYGPHWNIEQTKQVMAQRGIECDPVEYWVAINAIYSDYYKVAKELGINNIDFYAKMAKAFIDDKDTQPDKLALYYEYVVKH